MVGQQWQTMCLMDCSLTRSPKFLSLAHPPWVAYPIMLVLMGCNPPATPFVASHSSVWPEDKLSQPNPLQFLTAQEHSSTSRDANHGSKST